MPTCLLLSFSHGLFLFFRENTMSVCVATTPLERLSVATGQATATLRGIERRDEGRTDFSYRFRVALASGEDWSGDEETIVFGKDLTERGVGFLHDRPLPYRRLRLVAADPRLTEIGLADLEIELILRWCRFLAPGSYESGGRIARPTMGAA